MDNNKQDLCFNNTTCNMAASVAPNASLTNTASTCTSATNDIDNNNFHEICRSCGKTNAELYDLFQTANCWNTTTTEPTATATTASPFNTSSTTCYTHLNTSTSNSISCAKSSSSSSSSPLTSSSLSLTKSSFDSIAATAKATAKGQSNMENILQEMQIWHLQIKCNDGLPQRICAKCTAQFYMIHKFRRKCLKVQTQLRVLYEEGQKQQLLWDERHEIRQQQQQPQQQEELHKENDSQVTIVPTSTPPTPTTKTAATTTTTSVVKVPPELHKVNDLINDNYGKEQALSEKSSPSSVNIKTNTWNANDATLLDNVAKTMAKTEANATTPSLAEETVAMAVAAQQTQEKEHFTLLPKDQKKPPMVLNPAKHMQQICDNDVVATKNSNRGRLCVDQEELLAAHIIFKSSGSNNDNKPDELRHSPGDKVEKQPKMPRGCHVVSKQSTDNSKDKEKEKEFLKLSHFNETTTATTIAPPTESLFITKAALKAYTIAQTKTPSAYDNSQCSSTSSSTESSYENQVWQLASANSKQTTMTTLVQPSSFKTTTAGEALQQQVSATVTNIENDDNNNDHNKDHHHHRRRDQQTQNPNHHHHQQDSDYEMNLTDNTCCTSTTANSPRSPSLTAKMKLQNSVKTEVRFNNLKRSFAKRVRRCSSRAGNKRGHRYKLNAKTTTKTPTSRRRALLQTTRSTAAATASSNQRSQHELKRLQDIRTCSSSASAHKYQKQLKVEATATTYNQQTNIAAKSTYENETKNLTAITNKSNGMLKEKEDKLVTPATASTIIMEDESSSSIASSPLSSSSLASSASLSSSSSATTPAVTDLVKALKEKHETNAYATNANVNAIKRRHFISGTSRQGNDTETITATTTAKTALGATCYATSSTNQTSTTTSTSTTMWKTKAAMKANANDMHMDMDVRQQQQQQHQQQIDNEHQTNDDINQKPILLPYSTQKTTTTIAAYNTTSSVSTTTTATTTLCSNIDTRSKTLKNENQSICSSSSSRIGSNSNIMEDNVASSSETVLSSKDHKVKDIKKNNTEEQKQHLNNLRPEEADQKQIKHYYNLNDDENRQRRRTHEEANVEDHEKSEATENTFYNSMEFINNPLLTQQKPTSAATTATTTASTPPAKVGCMKLIIQRKRGARFKCRRKIDIVQQQTEHHISPKRIKRSNSKSGGDSKLEMESLFALDLNGDYSKEDKALINASNEDLTNDSDILENAKEHKNVIKGHYQIRERYSSESRDSDNSLIDNPEKDKENRDTQRVKEQECFSEKEKDSFFNPRAKIFKHNNSEDSESDNSLGYRDHNLCKNEINDEEEDEDTNAFSNHFQITKEQFKFRKEAEQMEAPKKLIIRVPLTSLTQDFKRLHLTIGSEEEKDPQLAEEQHEERVNETDNSTQVNKTEDVDKLNLSGSSQTDLLGFSPASVTTSNSLDSTQKSIEAIRYIDANNVACAASSKINDFINDFQNNCIDSSEIEEATEMIPQLPTSSQELSDEIRDVEDTLNGILSEMHDKDILYTPRSTVEHEDFFAHSVYSPLTDAPTTPSQSFYAESPCTVNGNPMSVSPYIHQNMDYNAMTPQSTHSSMGHNSHMSSCGGSTRSANVFSEHYPSYNECFAEESTESELIGFQNDIPCFENLELTNPATPSALLVANDGTVLNDNTGNDDEPCTPLKTQPNSVLEVTINKTEDSIKSDKEIVDYVDLCDYNEPTEIFDATPKTETSSPELPTNTVGTPEITANIPQFNTNNYQAPVAQDRTLSNNHTLMQTSNNNSMITSTPSHSHYIVTNTAQGPILIANPQVNTGQEQFDNAFKAHANNLQFVTLGQALEANKTRQQTAHVINNPSSELNWSSQANSHSTNGFAQQPVISTANGNTTTYFINAGGEVYRASIPTPSIQTSTLNTLIVPPAAGGGGGAAAGAQQPQPHTVAFNKPTIDANENYLQTLQQYTQQHHIQTQPQQQPAQHQSPPASQYIMVVNNLGATPQYFAATQSNLGQPTATTTAMGTPTVLYHQAATNNCSPFNNNNANNQLIQQTTTPESNRPTPSHTPVLKTLSPPPIQPFPKCSDPSTQQTMHQRINQQLQLQIKQRQLQLLQPRSPNCTQKINLICRFCHKRPKFTNNVDYSNHIINMHPAEKPYNCPHCPMHFTRRFERQQHVAQVHGSRYQCAQCGVSFCAQRTLDFHLQKYHANLGRSHHAASSTTTTTSSSSVNQQEQQQQQNSTSSSSAITTYQLLQHNQQQRLVRVEDVHVQVTGESRNKRSIDLQLDGSDIKASQSNNEVENLSAAAGTAQQQQPRKLCCPDCDGDNDDCCASNKHHDHNDQPISPQQLQMKQQQQQQQQQQQEQYTGNESVNHQHITMPSPEQTEPDSTTTLRHFRKRQLSELSPFSSSSSSSTASSSYLNNNQQQSHSNNNNNNNNCHDNVIAGAGGSGGDVSGGEQIAVERALRASHNCLLCEESFTNEIALRKHHHLAHGTQAASMAYVCSVCKRGFRMRNALQRHMETHDAEGRPYECNMCQVRFPRPSQLTLHKLTVHKFEKPNSCEECGKLFGSESALKAHAKVHEAATATSTSQLSSCMFMDSTTTTTIATTTTTEPTSNDLNVHLQLSTSGKIAATQILP